MKWVMNINFSLKSEEIYFDLVVSPTSEIKLWFVLYA